MSKKGKNIFLNGKIFTSNPEKPYANSMVVENGKIIWIGDERDLNKGEENIVDLKGRRVLPSFIDGHMHAFYLSNATKQISCTPPVINSIKDIIEEVSKMRKKVDIDDWIEGWGYDEGKLKEGRAPNRWDLDKGCDDVPVVITRTCVHIVSVNSKALEIAGIDKNTPDPDGGEIERDLNGEPTGILKENARNLVLDIMPTLNIEDSGEIIAEGGERLLAYGITVISDCMARRGNVEYYDMYLKAYTKGLKQRTVLYYLWPDLKNFPDLDEHKKDNNNILHIGGVKIIGDGSVSGRTAWIDEPYLGKEKTYGLPTTSKEELLEAAEYAMKEKLQLVIHAMGRKTIDLILDTFEETKSWLKDIPSIRIEHAAMLGNKEIQKAADLGIAFVSQPIFLYAEIETYLSNLGHERTRDSYPFKSILDGGVKLAFSSDAPATAWVNPANPFVAIKSAVIRKAYDGTDIGQEERIDVATAIELYTREAQQIVGIPYIGQLREGYYGDFIVLDKDILEINLEKIDEISVEETYINGKLVYEKDDKH
ncbi:amidohydrolase [Clostridium sp. D2Q-14]|uniref:amidohydrolase n=1 Tax=Anaeromonas gelatinilytica TaxID=2683194 RepID=UPI00193AF686|nr:amidohydrolase [Anaeromonas gelatinilytica]MBS4534906.1 amidohydrolase [Anaeromonas gelatinilytica]